MWEPKAYGAGPSLGEHMAEAEGTPQYGLRAMLALGNDP